MKDAFRKAVAAAAHRVPSVLSMARLGELGKVVQRRRVELEALRVRGTHSTVRPFHLQQKERALAEATAAHDAAVRRFTGSRREQA